MVVKEGLKTETYQGIDIFKFFAAIVVIAIHTNPFVSCSSGFIVRLYNSLQVCAVPLFFIFSGFLFGRKINTDAHGGGV